MKFKTKTPVILLITLIAAFAAVTCVNQDIKTLGTEAVLKSLQIVSGSITDTASVIARPIPASYMEAEEVSPSDLYGTDYDDPNTDIGWCDIRVRDKETGVITGRIRTVLSSGASSQWGIGSRTARPDRFYDTRVPATLNADDYIYIRVESEDGLVTQYYRFYAKLLSWTTNLQYLRINEREGKAGASISGESVGGSVWNAPTIKECSLSIGLKEGENALVEATTFDPNATVQYALADDNKTEPTTFTPETQRLNIVDQQYLYVRVTAENQIDQEYFRFLVSVGRMTTIKSLKVNDGTKDNEIYGLGLASKTWGTVGFGEYQTADQPDGGFFIKLEMDDPDAVYSYERIDGKDAAEPSNYTGNASSTAKIIFTNPQALAIKIKAPNDPAPLYYKVYITNLAANILVHPKTAWYYQDDIKASGAFPEGKKPVEPLSVTLDRSAKGTYLYQWYEADSWYGIYGRHGTSIDEKNNIATVNGGPGQYFYLVQGDEPPITLPPDAYTAADWAKSPGAWANWGDSNYYWADKSRGGEPMAWSIPGANGPTYTPRTDWVDDYANIEWWGTPAQNNAFPRHPDPPKVYFFSGSTNESRYYWVKVTDSLTGLSVTSKRALILTETNPEMDHFIFDLATLPVKNTIPFTKNGTDEDNVWRVSVKDYPFPADFEERVKNYQICIAHAQYFLPDGRPWTQNWTHGNLHIGVDGGYGELEWWHNNMGANGGSIPLQAPHSSKGGLIVKPDWIGFTPSGDPAKGLPPPIDAAGNLPKGIYSMDATEKYPAGVAQGYFAAFIELLELRFQNAPKK